MTLAGNLRVDTLNGLRVEEAARGLVLQDQDATIHGPHTLHLVDNTTGTVSRGLLAPGRVL